MSGLLLTDAAVGTEDAGRCEFTEFVTHHVFSDVNGDESLTVMNSEVMADKVRSNHGVAAPGLDWLAVRAGFGNGIDLGKKLLINEWAFLRERGIGSVR